MNSVVDAARSLVLQCVHDRYIKTSNRCFGDTERVPGEEGVPTVSTIDFALAYPEDGTEDIVPRLIELQGFPSMYGFQFELLKTMHREYGFSDELRYHFYNSDDEYISMLKELLVADQDPNECVLLEINPLSQKTLPDFLVTQRLTGMPFVDAREVEKEGNKLFYRKGGKRIQIKRIFNRILLDEQHELNEQLPFNWSDDLDVQWVCHPNWGTRISKFALPWLEHRTVPETTLLEDIDDLPEDLDQWILKPCFSFAGKGVNLSPTEEDIKAILPQNRYRWMLQRKVEFANVLPTPWGSNKVEFRVMLVWRKGQPQPEPAMTLIRTGRGPMMSIRHNTHPWTGSGGVFFSKRHISNPFIS